MIGLCGAHRTGKTTLAKEYAEYKNHHFLETSTSAVFRDLGYDPKGPFTFKERLTIQQEILKRMEVEYDSAPVGFITDRTPLDFLAYTMSEMIGDAVTEDLFEATNKYIEDCYDLCNKYFQVVILVQPGIPLIDEEGKALANSAYIEHLNSLILGLSVDSRLKARHFYIPRSKIKMEDRISAVESAVIISMEHQKIELDSYIETELNGDRNKMH